PLVEHLQSIGFTETRTQVLLLAPSLDRPSLRQVEGFLVIPARASFRHTRKLLQQMRQPTVSSSGKDGDDDVSDQVEAAMLHLDDPHYDAILAMKDGEPAAMAGVLAMGEVGLIEQVFVAERWRGMGLGGMILGRVLEICQRSLFKHVL